ncbi:MAG: hypothetical protein H0A76_04995 [Candidatus Thiodubiliella endoseptemdiera]|uniref:Uncharacterized protein n=1 Tax=Candidatus Thiodubiliella endoseptemdiera TaxID=2738886 RepID=A0A853F062_9GAMM|nr:hypothetical protein [Candidatus Thiodubiliella endoseptemdiera]
MNKLKLVGDIIFGSLFIFTLFYGVYGMVIAIHEFPRRMDGVFFGLSFGVIFLIISILIFKNFKNLHNKLEIVFNKAASRYSTKN